MRIVGLAVLCAATLVAPALMLVWMPIVLGVPHVASDVRYLVLPLPRRQIALAIAASAALVVIKAAGVMGLSLGVIGLFRAEVAVVVAWLLGSLVLEPTSRKRAFGIALFASALIVGMPLAFIVIAAMAHNAIAVAAWLVVAKPRRREAATLIAALLGFAVVAALAGPAISAISGGDVSPWLSVDKAATAMFGDLPLARGLLIAFAFLQGVHYSIWLGWIPASARATETTAQRVARRSPTATLAAFAVGVTTLVVIAGAVVVDPAWTRTTYLALATFHIYLELVVLGVRWAQRRAA